MSQVKTDDIWNLSITNTGTTTYNVHLLGTYADKNGQGILQLISENFNLEPGLKICSPFVVQTKTLTVLNNSYREVVEHTGMLPNGDYTACVKVIITEGNESNPDCKDILSVVMTPPELINPLDESTVTTFNPVFTWTPPKAYQPGSDIEYSIKIVEMLPGQSQNEAMLNNHAWYQADHLTNNMLLYPLDAQQLQDERNYAWQVHAYLKNTDIGPTEVWSFNLKKNVPEKDSVKICFAMLKDHDDAGYYVSTGILPFAFDDKYNGETFEARFFDENHKDITPENLKMVNGSNQEDKYIIDLDKYSAFGVNKFYYLQVKTVKNKYYNLKFKIQDTGK